MKKLQPLPHAILDYTWAVQMLSAPWLFGFAGNKRATRGAVSSGAAILGLSLLTRYPLGAIKAIPFPVHGAIEAPSGVGVAAAPWLGGFSKNKAARWTHVINGLVTLGVVAMTDYQAAERPVQQFVEHPTKGMESERQRSKWQVSTAAEYDQYSARPPLTHYRDSKQELQVSPS